MMSGVRFKYILLILATLWTGEKTLAQNQWDRVLDRYQYICEECLDLRARLASGQSVPDSSLSSLLGELRALRSSLQDASGSMTPQQRKRFADIRDRYIAQADGSQPVVTPKSRSAATVSRTDRATRASERPNSYAKPLPDPVIPRQEIRLDNPALEFPIQAEAPPEPQTVHDGRTKQQALKQEYLRPEYAAYVTVNFFDAASPGVFVSATKDRTGLYLSATSNLSPSRPSYDVSSDGNIEGGGRFWAGGAQAKVSILTASAGMVLRTKWQHLSLYAGAGYGRETLLWNDASGKWARVSDCSTSGVLLDAGATWQHNSLALLLGVKQICSGQARPCLCAGIGVVF